MNNHLPTFGKALDGTGKSAILNYQHNTVQIEIGKTCGAEGIGQIAFFVSKSII